VLPKRNQRIILRFVQIAVSGYVPYIFARDEW